MKSKLSEELYNDLLQKILFNQLKPGEMIGEEQLVQQYHVSRTPVRQALQQLERFGLVEIRDGVGTFVTYISPKQMKDAYQIRCMAEILAAETAIDRISEKKLDELEAQFNGFRAKLVKGGYGVSFEEMISADWELHDLILNNSDNRLLPKTIEAITLILRRYQFMYVTQYLRATEEHLQIISALREKDFEKLSAILKEHLRLRPM